MSQDIAGEGNWFKATTPDGRWSVVVDVLPQQGEFSEGEWFEAWVVLDGKNVIESLTTDSQKRLLNWCERQMVAAMRRNTL